MKSWSFERALVSHGPEETRELGRRIGQAAAAGDVIALSGPLGAGKTCLVQGLARGLGVPASLAVASPTFSLVHEYPGRLPVYHMDFYRLGVTELDEMGLEEYFEGAGVSVIEWAERWPELLEQANVLIRMDGRGEERTIVLQAREQRFENALDGPQ